MKRAFVVLNPAAGQRGAPAVERALERCPAAAGWTVELYRTDEPTGVGQAVREAVGRGCDVVIVAGGDGTISAAASGLEGTETPMAIVPAGTGNVLARELGVPLRPDKALDLLTGDHGLARVDALRLGERLCFLSVSVGVTAVTMRDTQQEDKRRFGRAAYVWTGLWKLVGVQPHRFTVHVDGRAQHVEACEVLVANSGGVGDPAFRWGPQVRLDDGRADVCLVRGRTAWDYVAVAWTLLLRNPAPGRHVRFLRAERSVTVEAERALAVQADGDFVGHTPVHVEVVPEAVRVVVPTNARRR